MISVSSHYIHTLMKKSICTTVLLFCMLTNFLFAKQPGIKGIIRNSNQEPVEFANVVLIQANDSSIVKAGLTETDGTYSFENIQQGQYKLLVVQLGFDKHYTESFDLKEGAEPMILKPVNLSESAINLREATVTAQRPFIEHRIDKTVVNVENSIVNAGSNAIEILKRSPGVTVDNEGNIHLSGKEGVNVMIDGKPTYLSAKDLYEMLKNMNSDQLSRIDIITNPSAKYDAAGNSGIIDIRLKKRQDVGLNGRVNGSYGQGAYPDGGGGISLNYRKEKFNLFGSYDYTRGYYYTRTTLARRFFSDGSNTLFDQSTFNKGNYTNQNFRGGIDYYLDKNHSISAVLRGNYNTNYDRTISTTLIKNLSEIADSSYITDNINNSKWNSITGTLNYQFKIDSLGKELSVDIDKARYDNANNFTFLTQYYDVNSLNVNTEYATNNQPAAIDIQSAKLDYTQPWKKTMKIEAGLKSSYVTTDNDVRYLNFYNGEGQLDTGKTNHFNYKENINAAYVNWTGEFKKVGFEIGLRGEQTVSEGQQVVNNETFERNYFQLFPSAFFNYKFTDKHMTRLSYSRRIDRPGYQQLNPFRYFLDPYNFMQGNPNLEPQTTDNYEVSYTFKQLYTITFNYSHTADAMTQITKQIDSTHTTYITTENLNTRNNYGVNINLPLHLTEWWTSSNNLSLFNNEYQGVSSVGNIDKSLTSYFLNSVNSFQGKKGWSFEISGYYQSQMVWGTWLVDPQWSVGGGISKMLMNERLQLRANINDIFHTQKEKSKIKYQNIDAAFSQVYDTQFVRFHVSYNFGKRGIKTKNHSRGPEEQNRINSGRQ